MSFSAWLSSGGGTPAPGSPGPAGRGGLGGRGRLGLTDEEIAAGEALLARLLSGRLRHGVPGAAPLMAVTRVGLVYGVGALRAAARGDRIFWAVHRAALAHGIVPVVPVSVIAEGFRTEARSDRIQDLLDGSEIEVMDAERARRVGELAVKAVDDRPRSRPASPRRRPEGTAPWSRRARTR
jgi:hypothetical protein